MKSNHGAPERSSRRPRRSQHEILSILQRHRLSGLSLLSFAREHDLCYATLLRWRSRPGVGGISDVQPSVPSTDRPHTPTFVPIELEPCPTASEFILIWAPNRSLRIPPGFDPTELRRLLDVLGVRS